MKQLLFCLTMLCAAQHVHADSDIYECVDKNGVKEYRNNGITKGCKKMELPGLTTIPATAIPPTAKKLAKSASSPADFPKVDEGTQKARDSDRKKILQDELKTESDKLAKLKGSYNNGEPERQGDEKNYAKYQDRVASMKDEIDRTEKNVDALNRELDNLK